MELILMMVAMFAILYFLMIRPQQKRMREHQEMQAQLDVGERVLLTSGMFGTIAHVGERQLIVELAPGVDVTVLKTNVARAVTADDEEFEFTDEDADHTDVVEGDDQFTVTDQDLAKLFGTAENTDPAPADPHADPSVAEQPRTEDPK